MEDIPSLLEEFALHVAHADIEIYNEFSLQFELGIFLRSRLGGQRVEFERNVVHFFQHKDFKKKEIDITVVDSSDRKPLCAIELKFPRNGQVPEQMFTFCKDIMFLEQLKKAGISNAFFIAFVDNKLFWEGPEQGGIYQYFRGDSLIHGLIEKPTGEKNEKNTPLAIQGQYKAAWRTVNQNLRWLLIKVSTEH